MVVCWALPVAFEAPTGVYRRGFFVPATILIRALLLQ
jgi:hypothetical protein